MKVDVRAVETELARLQRELTNSEVRTSLFNLVVMSPDAEQAMVDEALNELLGKRAARVIHIVNKADVASDLEVSARCFVDRDHKGVCFEEIIITNGADGAGGAPGSWIPLLVRDIPTYILWLDTLTDRRELFSHVRSQADKVIVDADHCVDLGDEPDELLTMLATVAVEDGVPLADFSWKRLRPHQRLAAEAFDGDRTEWLSAISRVDVTGLPPAAGRLYGLWLAERLGWIPAAVHGDLERYRAPHGGEIVVARATGQPSGQRPGQPGCEVSVRVSLEDGRTLAIETERNGCAEVEYPEGSDEHLVTIPTNGEILLEEVDAVYADDFYRNALELLL